MPARPARRALPVLALAATLLAGCGGGQDRGPFAQQELASKASSICKDAAAPLEFLDPLGATPSRAKVANYYRVLAATTRRRTDTFGDLDPTPEAAGAWRAFVGAQTRAATAVEALRDVAEGPGDRAASSAAAGRAIRASQRSARRFGATDCTRGAGVVG